MVNCKLVVWFEVVVDMCYGSMIAYYLLYYSILPIQSVPITTEVVS